jgi:hypothetical protein
LTVAVHQITASVGDTALDVKAGSVTLDEGWSPYAKAQLTLALPDVATRTMLDPRANPRVTITTQRSVLAGASFVVQSSRTFDLVVRGWTVDHNADTLTLGLASDEALLQDIALIDDAPDTSALAHQSSVRAIINGVLLARIDAELEDGDADADFTTLTALTNLVWNGSFENGTAYWFAGGTNATGISSSTAWASSGTRSLSVGSFAHAQDCFANYTAPGNGAAGGDAGAIRTPFTAGKMFTVIGTGHVPAAMTGSAYPNRARTITVFVKAPSLGANYVEYHSAAIPNITGATARVGVTFTVPSDATEVFFRLYCGHVDGSIMWDDIVIVEGDGLETDGASWLQYWDGSTTDTDLYTYAYATTASPAYAAASTRTPVFQRDPDTLTWQPGEDAWDFIEPVLTQAGLRLFCDEQRVWRLVDNTYAIPGRVTVAAGFNAYTGTDTIDRDAAASDGSPLWFDSVVVKYSWTDRDGTQQTRYDYAADDFPTKTALITYSRPYPGPGAARYILARVQGQGRVLALTAAVDYSAQPGMEASATLPATEDQTGYTSSITWDFGSDEMTVGTRGLIDTPPSAWVQLPEGQSWLDSPVGASWISEVI